MQGLAEENFVEHEAFQKLKEHSLSTPPGELEGNLIRAILVMESLSYITVVNHALYKYDNYDSVVSISFIFGERCPTAKAVHLHFSLNASEFFYTAKRMSVYGREMPVYEVSFFYGSERERLDKLQRLADIFRKHR